MTEQLMLSKDAFIDFILSRGYADGVFLAGCSTQGCQYRLGGDWTDILRAAAECSVYKLLHQQVTVFLTSHDAGDVERASAELAAFREAWPDYPLNERYEDLLQGGNGSDAGVPGVSEPQ